METLEELRKKFSNLDEERSAVYEKILKLEQQEITNNFVIGECCFNPYCESFKKIIAIKGGVIYCIVVDDKSIERDFYYLSNTKYWRKITTEHPELPPFNIKENEENFIIFDGCNVFNTYIL